MGLGLGSGFGLGTRARGATPLADYALLLFRRVLVRVVAAALAAAAVLRHGLLDAAAAALRRPRHLLPAATAAAAKASTGAAAPFAKVAGAGGRVGLGPRAGVAAHLLLHLALDGGAALLLLLGRLGARVGARDGAAILLAVDDLLGEHLEGLRHVGAVERARLEEDAAELAREALAHLLGDLPLAGEVALVAHDDALHVAARVLVDVRHPVANVVEGLEVRHAVHEADAVRALVVRARDDVELLLSRSIPDLQPHALVLHVRMPHLVVHARRGQQRARELVLRVAQHERRLPHAAVPQQQQPQVRLRLLAVAAPPAALARGRLLQVAAILLVGRLGLCVGASPRPRPLLRALEVAHDLHRLAV
mmetsp:Transcript_6979/g.20396  ORF Transcript_6979/g.20396 Transcript_6979/m.20396 type:complete len:364 (+) Transcript_6979:171-1262(+)